MPVRSSGGAVELSAPAAGAGEMTWVKCSACGRFQALAMILVIFLACRFRRASFSSSSMALSVRNSSAERVLV